MGHFCIEVADAGYFPVVPASSLSMTSDSSCIDGAWTHFFHSSNNQILLSLKIGSTGAIIPNDGVTIDADGASDVFWVPSVPGNLVEWTTASEINTKTHILERSTDGTHFSETIGQLNGAGNSNHPVNYQLRDNAPLFKGFYRLKTIDFDGKQQYSNIINLERKGREEGILYVFPNPVKNQLTIQISASTTGPANFSLTDVAGKQLFDIKNQVEKGINVKTLDLSYLPAGVYYLSFKNGKVHNIKRIVKG